MTDNSLTRSHKHWQSPAPFGEDVADQLIENTARAFHENYERLAPDFGYKTRDASAVPWEDVPIANRSLMMATVAALVTADRIRLPWPTKEST